MQLNQLRRGSEVVAQGFVGCECIYGPGFRSVERAGENAHVIDAADPVPIFPRTLRVVSQHQRTSRLSQCGGAGISRLETHTVNEDQRPGRGFRNADHVVPATVIHRTPSRGIMGVFSQSSEIG